MGATSFLSGAISGFAGQKKKQDDESSSGSSKKTQGVIPKLYQKYKASKQKKQGANISDSPIGAPGDLADPTTAKKGAKKVKKTGWMKVHKNERVLTKKQAKKMDQKKGKSKRR